MVALKYAKLHGSLSNSEQIKETRFMVFIACINPDCKQQACEEIVLGKRAGKLICPACRTVFNPSDLHRVNAGLISQLFINSGLKVERAR